MGSSWLQGSMLVNPLPVREEKESKGKSSLADTSVWTVFPFRTKWSCNTGFFVFFFSWTLGFLCSRAAPIRVFSVIPDLIKPAQDKFFGFFGIYQKRGTLLICDRASGSPASSSIRQLLSLSNPHEKFQLLRLPEEICAWDVMRRNVGLKALFQNARYNKAYKIS